MPMTIPARGAPARGESARRDFESWFSQLLRDSQQNITPLGIMDTPPNATLTKATGVSAASLVTAGTGYTSGDALTVTGGTFVVAARIRITGVDSDGAITTAAVQQGGVYSAAPTNPAAVTGGTGTGATFNLTFNPGVSSSIFNPLLWPRTNLSAFEYTGYSPKDSVAGYRGNGVQNGTQMVIAFDSDAPTIDFRFVGGNYQGDLYVDGLRISTASIKTDTSGAPYIYTVDWSGVVKTRRYRLCGINTGFGGIYTGQAYTVTAPVGQRRPLIWQMGDSYTVGIGAAQNSYNDFRVMCDLLGADGIADGISGSGWTSIQSDRIPAWRVQNKLGVITRQPDFIFFSLGYNDYAADLTRIPQPFTDAVAAARSICPLAKIIVIGPATPLGHTAQLDGVRSTIMGLCETLGLTFVDMRDVVNAANKQMYTGSDSVHPSNAGHIFRGTQIAMRMTAVM